MVFTSIADDCNSYGAVASVGGYYDSPSLLSYNCSICPIDAVIGIWEGSSLV